MKAMIGDEPMHETSPVSAFLRHIQLLYDESCKFCATLVCEVFATSKVYLQNTIDDHHFFREVHLYLCTVCNITN